MTSIAVYTATYLHAAERAKAYIQPVFTDHDDQARSYALSAYKLSSLDELWAWEGCSATQIEEVRAAWDGWLPESFEAYLQVMGIKSRYVNIGVDCNYPTILEAKRAYERWVKEARSIGSKWYGNGERFPVPEEAYHLGHHQGYIFEFIADRSSDPIVYRLMEGDNDESGVTALDQSFSELVVDGIDRACASTEKLLANSVRRRKPPSEQ